MTTVDFEGSVPYLYLDTKGIVTVGCGHACFSLVDAQNIRGWDKPEAVRSDFEAVKRAPVGHAAGYYANYSQARLPDWAITKMFDVDAEKHLAILRKSLPNLDRYPQPARVALTDMAFNLGGSFLEKRNDRGLLVWPHFFAAALNQHWNDAAAQCWRKDVCPSSEVQWGPRDVRNNWTRQKFLDCIG